MAKRVGLVNRTKMLTLVTITRVVQRLSKKLLCNSLQGEVNEAVAEADLMRAVW